MIAFILILLLPIVFLPSVLENYLSADELTVMGIQKE